MTMNNQTDIDHLLADLPGARTLSALELNEMRFSGRKTVITPGRLRSRAVSDRKSSSTPR